MPSANILQLRESINYFLDTVTMFFQVLDLKTKQGYQFKINILKLNTS